jgi:hypothetical protein
MDDAAMERLRNITHRIVRSTEPYIMEDMP